MTKTTRLLAGIILGVVGIAANAAVYCPPGPADGVARQGAECSYFAIVNNQWDSANFLSRTNLVRANSGEMGWTRATIGYGFTCGPIPGVCPFTQTSG